MDLKPDKGFSAFVPSFTWRAYALEGTGSMTENMGRELSRNCQKIRKIKKSLSG